MKGKMQPPSKLFLFEWHIVAKGTQQHNICNISWVLTFLSWRCIAHQKQSPHHQPSTVNTAVADVYFQKWKRYHQNKGVVMTKSRLLHWHII